MGEKITVVAPVDLKAWQVPRFAALADVDVSIPIAKLPPEALDHLAGLWLARLYESVNRACPFDIPSTRSGIGGE